MSSSFIDGINQAATASNSASSTKAAGQAAMGKEDFLKLLVAQLQNQDPLSPDNPTEFTAQLAQFSSLEQLYSLNNSMKELTTSNTNSDNLSTLNTIGKQVSYSADSFTFSGTPVTLGYKLDGDAAGVTLALQKNGTTVATLTGKELSAGNHYLTWNGLTTDGLKAASGDYKVIVQATDASGKTVSASSLIKSEVTGVDLNGTSGSTLITKVGKTPFSAVVGVFDQNPSTNTATTSSQTTTQTTGTVNKVLDTASAVADTTKQVTNVL